MPTFWAYFDINKTSNLRISVRDFGSKNDALLKRFERFKVSFFLWLATFQASFLVAHKVDANFLSLFWRQKNIEFKDLSSWFWLKKWRTFETFTLMTLIYGVDISVNIFGHWNLRFVILEICSGDVFFDHFLKSIRCVSSETPRNTKFSTFIFSSIWKWFSSSKVVFEHIDLWPSSDLVLGVKLSQRKMRVLHTDNVTKKCIKNF